MTALKSIYRFFKNVGLTGWSRKTNLFGMNPLIVSTAFLIFTVLLAKTIRKTINATANGMVRTVLLEFLATAELCACCFELCVVADNYGVWTYALFLFLLTIWWMQNWESASACPYAPMEEMLEGGQTFCNAAIIIVSQLTGGYLTYKYVEMFWALELVETHRGKVDEECSADLQVPMLMGALIEGGATCACRIVSRLLGETNYRFAPNADAFFATMMVVAAFNFSGGYFNPALATSLKFGCDGQTFLEFMVVYWLGACLGALASSLIYNSAPMKRLLNKDKEKEE